jgi:hypothetical protein
MEHWSRGSRASKAFCIRRALCCAIVLALLSGGCSASRQAARRQGFMRVVTPLPPAFLTGPAVVLFTNWAGFSAHLEALGQGAADTARATSGQLLGRGPQLLYAPETDESPDSHRQPGGYSFIWNAAENRGFVLSEALQGYAPFTADLRVTNVLVEIGKGVAQRISGHPCEPAKAAVFLADGTIAGFEMFRAIDLSGFPVRVESATNSSVFTLDLTKVRLEQPPADVFSPPQGFTKYATPEAMADELAARQNNLRRKSPSQMEPIPGMERGRY